MTVLGRVRVFVSEGSRRHITSLESAAACVKRRCVFAWIGHEKTIRFFCGYPCPRAQKLAAIATY